jgi:hypothetical protein
VRRAGQRTACPRLRLTENEVALEVERTGAACPLSSGEIIKWAERLKGAGTDNERRLRNLVTYWFQQASSFSQIWPAVDKARVRQYVRFRLEQGDPSDTITLPPHFHRIDKWLPDISSRLSAIQAELLGLPGAVSAALRVRFGNYDQALAFLAALPAMLNAVADTWYRQGPGQPSLELESEAVGLLTCAIEDYTGEKFPSPRSIKRQAEIELARLLAARLFPSRTPKQINTMLGHFHRKRPDDARGGRPHPTKKAGVVYSGQKCP